MLKTAVKYASVVAN